MSMKRLVTLPVVPNGFRYPAKAANRIPLPRWHAGEVVPALPCRTTGAFPRNRGARSAEHGSRPEGPPGRAARARYGMHVQMYAC